MGHFILWQVFMETLRLLKVSAMVSWTMKYPVTGFNVKSDKQIINRCIIMGNSWLEIHLRNFHFAVYRGHGIPFMDFSQELHGIKVKFVFMELTLTSMITLHWKVNPSMEFNGHPWRFHGTP